jgi:hypothetical protein
VHLAFAGLFLRYPARVELLTLAEPRMAVAATVVAGLTLAAPFLVLCSGQRWTWLARTAAVGWVAYVSLLSPTLGLLSHGIPMLAADR